MDGGAWDREGHDGEQRGASRLQKDMFCERFGEVPDHQGCGEGQGKGDGKTGEQCPFRMVRVRRNKAGDGSLDGSGAEGEEDPIDRKDHLIDPKSFRADGAGEKDPVEKTENAGEKSCGGEEKSSGDKRMSFMGRRHERLRSVRRIRLYICGKKRRI